MHDGIGRTADREQHAQPVLECLRRHDLGRREPFFRNRHRARARRFGVAYAIGHHRGNCSASRQHHAHRFSAQRHRARGSHHHARAGGRRELLVDLVDFLLVDLARAKTPPEAPAVGARAEPFAAMIARQHGPGHQHDRRNIGAGSPHQQRRHRLVAAANEDRGVDRLRARHFLGVHRHQVAQIHAGRIGERFVQRDDRKLDRQPAGEHDAALNRFDQIRHRAMAGVESAEGVGDAYDGAVECIVRIAHRLDESGAQKQRKILVAVRREPAPHALFLARHKCQSGVMKSPHNSESGKLTQG